MTVPPPFASRLQALAALRSTIFQTSYNPTGVRTGASILKARLQGPAMVAYYPPPKVNVNQLGRMFGIDLRDVEEETRLADVETKRRKGKGPPKKGEGKRKAMKARGKK